MQDRQLRCSRRKFLASAAALGIAGALAGSANAGAPAGRPRMGHPDTKGRKPLAVVTTVYRPLSHAYHIAGRFLHGYPRGGKLHVPHHYVHSLYVDQTPDNDLSRELGRDFGVRVTRNVADALIERRQAGRRGRPAHRRTRQLPAQREGARSSTRATS